MNLDRDEIARAYLDAHPAMTAMMALLTELRDFKPTVFSCRASDPQDDLDDLMPLAEFEAFQEDAAKLLAKIDSDT